MDNLKEWNEVAAIHGTVAGIATKAGRCVSLLCNQMKEGKYPDIIDGDRLTYHIGRRTQRNGVEALYLLQREPADVRVFEKVGSNQWRDLGYWRFHSVGPKTSDGTVPFHFVRVTHDEVSREG